MRQHEVFEDMTRGQKQVLTAKTAEAEAQLARMTLRPNAATSDEKSFAAAKASSGKISLPGLLHAC